MQGSLLAGAQMLGTMPGSGIVLKQCPKTAIWHFEVLECEAITQLTTVSVQMFLDKRRLGMQMILEALMKTVISTVCSSHMEYDVFRVANDVDPLSVWSGKGLAYLWKRHSGLLF
jgi:hypothetical protein